MTSKTIAAAGIVTVGVGSVNAIANHKTLPSTRFLLGSGVLYLILSVMADAGQEELAQALAIAVMTTVVLGEGNGVLSWVNNKGEIDTQKPKNPRQNNGGAPNTVTHSVPNVYGLRRADPAQLLPPYPGIPATN